MPINTTRKIRTGLIPYGSDDESIVEKATFEDAINVGSALIDTSVANFFSDGMQVTNAQGGSAGRIRYTSGFTAQFANGGHVSFDLTPEIIDDSTVESLNAILINIEGTNSRHIRKTISSNWELAGGSVSTKKARLENTGMAQKVRVYITWNNYGIGIIVDGFLCRVYPWGTRKPAFNSSVDLLSQNRTFQVTKSRISNVQWSTKQIALPIHPSLLTLSVIGDSQTKNGQYPTADLEVLGYSGTDYGDSTLATSNTYKNRGTLPVIHGELAKRGKHVAGRIHWHGRGSTQVYSGATYPLSARTDSLLADTGTDYPTPGQRNNTKVLSCCVGTNDVASSVSDANFESSFKAEIDRWVAAGIQTVILVNIAQRYSADLSTKIDTTDTISKNAIIKTLIDYSPIIKDVVDIYTPTSDDSGYITTGDGIHLSIRGHSLTGKLVANTIHKYT